MSRYFVAALYSTTEYLCGKHGTLFVRESHGLCSIEQMSAKPCIDKAKAKQMHFLDTLCDIMPGSTY